MRVVGRRRVARVARGAEGGELQGRFRDGRGTNHTCVMREA